MNKDELINMVKEFLDKKGKKYYPNSIDYNGYRENFKQIDGSEKSVHVVSYMVSISDQQYGGDASYFVHIDAKTNKPLYIIGPQSVEMIE